VRGGYMHFRTFLPLMLAGLFRVAMAQEIDIRPIPAAPAAAPATTDLGIRPLPVAGVVASPTAIPDLGIRPVLAAPTPANEVPATALARPLPTGTTGGMATASAAKRWEVRTADLTLKAGYRVRWDAKKNLLVEAPDVFVGTFEQAMRQALSSPGIAYGDYPLEACVYPNNPLLIRITRQGEQARECPEVITE